MTHGVLIVTSAPLVAARLAPQLEATGWQCDVAGDPAAALASFSSVTYAVVLIDAAFMDDTPTICASLKGRFDAPILVFDRELPPLGAIPILEAGADDYMDRLDRPNELVARMRALSRRAVQRTAIEPSVPDEGLLLVGDVRLDTERHEVHVRGQLIGLTLRQFDLLYLLLRHPNQVLPRSTILERVWGSMDLQRSNTLEVQIMRLRRWIEIDPTSPTVIRTVRGVGYQLVDR